MESFRQTETLRPPPYGPATATARLLRGLNVGDERIDSLTDKELFRAIHGEVDHIPPEKEPEWADYAAIKRGQAVYMQHMSSFVGSLLGVLLHGFIIGRFSDVLVLSGYSRSPWETFMRFNHTAQAIRAWMSEPNIEDPQSYGRRVLMQVRCMHGFARRRARPYWAKEAEREIAAALSAATAAASSTLERKEESASDIVIPPPDTATTAAATAAAATNGNPIGIPLSQFDMATVQLGFSTVCLDVVRSEIREQLTEQEERDYVHLWRYLGWHLGIYDEFNCCNSYEDALRLRDEFYLTVPHYARAVRPSTHEMIHSCIKGFGRYLGVGEEFIKAYMLYGGVRRPWLELSYMRPYLPVSEPALLFIRFHFALLAACPPLRRLLHAWWRVFHRGARAHPHSVARLQKFVLAPLALFWDVHWRLLGRLWRALLWLINLLTLGQLLRWRKRRARRVILYRPEQQRQQQQQQPPLLPPPPSAPPLEEVL